MSAFLKSLKEHWFILGLLGIAGLTLVDGTGLIAGGGKWLKAHQGPNGVVALIFFMSGLILKWGEVRSGLGDVKGTLVALGTIILLAPLAAMALYVLPLSPGLRIGLLLVAVMPTTLTTGVVMTGAAGGNMAHALLITVLSNLLGVLTVPLSLSLLLGLGNAIEAVPIDRWGMMTQIALLVVIPLMAGMALRHGGDSFGPLRKAVPIINQGLVLAILWMAFSEARSSIMVGGAQLALTVLLSFLYHAILVAAAFGVSRVFNLGPRRRESVVFMGGQKTLPLSVLIQVTLFPQHGIALAYCVLHHLIHLIMDGYLVGWFRRRRQP